LWSGILSRPLENEFKIIGKVREAYSPATIPSQEVNKSLLKVNDELQNVWYGQIVAYGLQAKGDGSSRAHDMGALEFRHTVDAMRMRYDKIQTARKNWVEGPSVMGVRGANVMDTLFSFHAPLACLPVEASQCTTDSDIEASLCDQIGIPLMVRRLPLALTGRDRRAGLPNEVLGFTPLLRFISPHISPLDNSHDIGSAIVVRKDGKPLLAAHVRAFTEYGTYIRLKRNFDNDSWAPINISTVSKELFMAWYEKWRIQDRARGEVDVAGPSPYEV
jgi:hypothetical protein